VKTYRFEILCTDNKWRYVFCRAMNGGYDFATDSAVITTERKANAYASYSEEQASKDMAYFSEHSHGAVVRVAA
jgi:hypothetical protein